jgi:hypothetical protein
MFATPEIVLDLEQECPIVNDAIINGLALLNCPNYIALAVKDVDWRRAHWQV